MNGVEAPEGDTELYDGWPPSPLDMPCQAFCVGGREKTGSSTLSGRESVDALLVRNSALDG
jgi:hypothetical protein